MSERSKILQIVGLLCQDTVRKKIFKMIFYLVVKHSRQSDEQNFKHARFEERDLVVVMQALEAGHQLGKVAHLPHVVHEALGELLLQEGVLGSALHGTCLENREEKLLFSVEKNLRNGAEIISA